jgi:U6 snRNA-associated Sm-like protein LSm6
MSDAEPTASVSPAAPNEATGSTTTAAKNGIAAAAVKGSPNDFLKKVIGKQVIVRLNSGVDYHGKSMHRTFADLPPACLVILIHYLSNNSGTLSCLDGFMNIALEETQEVVEGVQRGKYGDTFIRGNNGESIQRIEGKLSSAIIDIFLLLVSLIYHCKVVIEIHNLGTVFYNRNATFQIKRKKKIK